MPDDELFQLALAHRLRDPEVLHAQIHRMLLDPKSRALVENFGGQWLQTRNLESIQPDPAKFPQFDASSAATCSRRPGSSFNPSFATIAPSPISSRANYTFLNERLAAFYGIPGVEGRQFRRVDLPPDSHRGGILTQASVLTVSSYPAAHLARAAWKMDPAKLARFRRRLRRRPTFRTSTRRPSAQPGQLRQQLEQHRANPACSGCHARMDPLGFDLENYDAIGQWRTQDGSFPDRLRRWPRRLEAASPQAIKTDSPAALARNSRPMRSAAKPPCPRLLVTRRSLNSSKR